MDPDRAVKMSMRPEVALDSTEIIFSFIRSGAMNEPPPTPTSDATVPGVGRC